MNPGAQSEPPGGHDHIALRAIRGAFDTEIVCMSPRISGRPRSVGPPSATFRGRVMDLVARLTRSVTSTSMPSFSPDSASTADALAGSDGAGVRHRRMRRASLAHPDRPAILGDHHAGTVDPADRGTGCCWRPERTAPRCAEKPGHGGGGRRSGGPLQAIVDGRHAPSAGRCQA